MSRKLYTFIVQVESTLMYVKLNSLELNFMGLEKACRPNMLVAYGVQKWSCWGLQVC